MADRIVLEIKLLTYFSSARHSSFSFFTISALERFINCFLVKMHCVSPSCFIAFRTPSPPLLKCPRCSYLLMDCPLHQLRMVLTRNIYLYLTTLDRVNSQCYHQSNRGYFIPLYITIIGMSSICNIIKIFLTFLTYFHMFFFFLNIGRLFFYLFVTIHTFQ